MQSTSADNKNISPETRYHPLLPTVKEAQENKKSFYSDHLPVVSWIPAGNTKLKVISWNVYIPNLGSGYDLMGRDGENEKDAADRMERSLNALAAMIAEEKPDVICLQENYFDLVKLKQKLTELHWQMDPDDDKNATTVTLFNPEKLEQLALPKETEKKSGYQPSAMQKTLFKVKGTGSADSKDAVTIMMSNVHLPHDDVPHEAEEFILATLKKDQAQYGNAAMAGDFNNRYVPLNKSYLPNNVAGSGYRTEIEMQGTDFTDGFFYMSGDQTCHQPEKMDVIDPSSGKIYQMPEVKREHFKNEKQKKELERFRPMLCCAEEYKNKSEFKLNEEELKELKEIGVFVGRDVTSFNKQKEVVRYPEKRNRQHLEALDKCLLLFTSPNAGQLNLVKQCFVNHIDFNKAMDFVERGKPEYKFENLALKELLKECDAKAKEKKLAANERDLYFKSTLLSTINASVTQQLAFQYAANLIENTPIFAIECMRNLDPTKISADERTFLMKRVMIAHVKKELHQVDAEKNESGGLFNIMKRKTLDTHHKQLEKLLSDLSSTDDVGDCQRLINQCYSDQLKNDVEADISRFTKKISAARR